MKVGSYDVMALTLGDCAPMHTMRPSQDGSEGWKYRLPSSVAASLGVEAASLKAPGELFGVVTQGLLP
jgi:hypothetical protein